MKNKYIELRQRRDLGDIITIYFDFLKQNIKSFTNIFINYNGIFIVLLLGASYLMVTGGIGMYNSEKGFGNTTENEALIYLGLGFTVFFVVFLCIAAINYSLASTYMIKYEENKNIISDKTEIWEMVKANASKIFIFILLLVAIYFAFVIVSFLFILIPILGTIAQYIIQFFVTSWLGISFMVMLNENKSPADALGEGWSLVKGNFWKCVGVNFILGLLLGLVLMMLLVIPGVIVGVYSFHALDTGVNFGESIVAKIIFTLAACIVLIIMAYSQSLSQFINGILYFSLHEEKHNINTREKIDQIGLGE